MSIDKLIDATNKLLLPSSTGLTRKTLLDIDDSMINFETLVTIVDRPKS